MTMDENRRPTPLTVNITVDTANALSLVMKREGITVTEALRRLVGYGELVYRTIRVDGHEVLIRQGRKRQQIKLLD